MVYASQIDYNEPFESVGPKTWLYISALYVRKDLKVREDMVISAFSYMCKHTHVSIYTHVEGMHGQPFFDRQKTTTYIVYAYSQLCICMPTFM